MQDEPLDMLQIKINKAKEELPKETIRAIDSVDWKGVILGMREKKGYNLEQLEELELDTELLLCGLLKPENYPKELEEGMKIPKPQVDLLVSEMNEFVFKKIREKLIQDTEKEEMFIKKVAEGNEIPIEIIPRPEIPNTKNPGVEAEKIIGKSESSVLRKAGIEIEPIHYSTPVVTQKTNEPIKTIPTPNIPNQNPEKENTARSIPFQKLSGSFQIPTTKTEYSLSNLSKQENKNETKIPSAPTKIDPYRINPNE
jgi:hypothetical protein